MKFNFSGKTVVITGGTAGIGFAAARLFGECGANVAICGTNINKLNSAVNYLKSENITIFGDICDVRDQILVGAFADKVNKAFGSIDVWVNNAGYMDRSMLIDVTEEICDKHFDTNVKSVIWGAQTAFRLMSEKGGVIINATSYAAIKPAVGGGIYAASKAAIMSLTKTLASEFAPYNIRVVGYAPGNIATDMAKDLISENGESLVSRISSHRIGEPGEVAALIVFLASDYSSYINGTSIEISGGKFSTQNVAEAWKF